MAKKVNSFEGPESQMEQRKKIIFHLPATVTTTPHREPFVQLSPLPDHSLLVTGQDGLISVWNQDLKLKKSKRILQENKQQTRNMKWILDSEIMLQYNKLIIGTCEREIRFYELSSLDPYCQIVGVETMPLHLGFSPRNKDEGILYFGDEKGCVNIIVASNMGEVLRIWAKCQPVEEIPTISINDIEDSSRVKFIRWKVHNDWVSQVRYISSIQSLVSSSNDGYNALVIGCVEETKNLQKQLKDIFESSSIRSKRSLLSGNVPSRRNPWDESVFRVRKGIKTFDFCKERNILVTGGLDRTVRLWNLHVPGWPIGVLRGHSSPIMYLRIGDENTRIYSISADCTVMVWDIEDHSCLVRVISKASYIKGELDACYFSQHLKAFFVATDSLAVLRVQQNTQQSRLQSVSHNDPVTCCQYIKQFHQIVSCSEGSGIKTWDIFTGQLVFEVRSAHGSSPISCLAIDYNGKSMLTGGWDGSLKQWYYRSDSIGLKKILKPVNSMEEVIDCTYAELRNNRYIISVGCDSQIQVYPDQEEVTSRNPSPPLNWINTMKDGHKDEILCVTSFPPNLLATSSFDGEVVVWNLISGNIFCCLSDSKQVAPKDVTDALVINKVVFIQSRIEQKNESAVLIASGPRGQITFWNIFGGGRVFGRFPGSQYNSVVTDMAVSEDDSLLCAADQQFSVYIWNISQYALHGLEDKPPTLLHCWRAHLCDITSVIPMSKHGLVVTSSMDCTVKLWSLQGEHIGTFGQNELWDITKKESWKEQSIVSSLNTPKSPPKPMTGTNSSLSIESNSIISEVTVSSDPIDNKEIVKELKNLNILKAQNRVQQVGSKTTDIQQVCGRVNSYQSLKIFDLLYVPPTIRKPNPAAEINDPYDLSI